MVIQSHLRNSRRSITLLLIIPLLIILSPETIHAADEKRSLYNYGQSRAGGFVDGMQISTSTPTSTATPSVYTCPGALSGTSLVFNRPEENGTNPPSILSGNPNSRLRTTIFTVSVTGTYVLTMTIANFTGGSPDDGFYILYSPSFTPGTPLVNALEANDDAGPGLRPQITRNLTAGTQYILVATTFADNQTGGFVDEFSGPGTVNFTCTDMPTNTPTPTPTFTPSNTPTNTPTFTPSNTPTLTPSNTPTLTPSNTSTNTPTFTPSSTPTFTSVPVQPDTIGVYKSGVFSLRNSNTGGLADITVNFGGDASDLPVAGDWNGDGVDTVGVYRGSTGVYFLSDSNIAPAVNYSLVFGNPGDTPFAGKWTNTMTHDGVGVYRNSNGILYQKTQLTTGFSDYFAIFGNPGDQGFSGDFDGNGFDSIGVYRSSNTTWYMTNNSQPSGITFSDIDFVWNITTRKPVIGDWNGDGISTVGYFAAAGLFGLHSTNAAAGTDNTFAFGPSNAYPIAGKWVAAAKPPVSNVISNGQGSASGSNLDGKGNTD